MMASELADSIWVRFTQDAESLRDIVDAELQEVREVLDLCEAALAAAEPYVARDLAVAIRERRQRARQLAERLRVDSRKGNDGK